MTRQLAQIELPAAMLEGEYLLVRYGATVADYEQAADEDTRLELLDGVMMMHSPASVRHEEVFWFLGTLLRRYVATHALGRVLGSRTPMHLDDERRFEPDLLFVASENLHRLGDTALIGPADWVIEILSPATREYDLGKKRNAYAAGGVGEYWMVDLQEQMVLIDRPAGVRVAEVATGPIACHAVKGLNIQADWLWKTPPPDANRCLDEVTS